MSPTDIASAQPGAGETATDASTDEAGGSEQGGHASNTVTFKAPMRQFLDNIYPYTTTAGQTKTFAELFTALGITKSVDDITSISPTSNDKLGLDEAGKKITPQRYGTVEMVNFYFTDGTGIQVEFTDSSFARDIKR